MAKEELTVTQLAEKYFKNQAVSRMLPLSLIV